LTVKTYTEALLKAKALLTVTLQPILVFALTANTYTEVLLKDRSAPDGQSTAYIVSSPDG